MPLLVLTTLQMGRIAHVIQGEYERSWMLYMPMTDTAIHPKGVFALAGPVEAAVAAGLTVAYVVPQTGHRVPMPPIASDPPMAGDGYREELPIYEKNII